MGLIARIRGAMTPQAQAIQTSHDLAEFLRAGQQTWSGIEVTPEEAMRYAPFGTAIRVISESVAQLPFHVHERSGEDGREREVRRDHPVDRVFNRKPNSWQAPFEFREWATRHAAATGDAFALKVMVDSGRVLRELVPIHPARVMVEQDSDFAVTYRVTMQDNSQRTFGQRDIFHLRGPSDDGVTGVNMVHRHKEAIALGLAQDRHAATLFGNGAQPSGVLKTPNKLSDKAWEHLRRWFTESTSGNNANSLAVLEEGLEFQARGMTSEAAQLLESRKLQRSVVASILRIPPHLIGDLERATFSNIEELARSFVDYTLMPWLDRWEQAVDTQLMGEVERGRVYTKHNVNSLLRGNAQQRAEFYNAGIQNGWLSPNEAREKEDMNPRDGGDEFKPAENLYGDPDAGSDDNQESSDANE